MEDTIRLRLLGAVLVEREGEPVRGFGSRKALALLGYLAVQSQPVSRERLVDLFWCDKTETQGRANLSWVLHRISEVLPGCLETERHTVQFRCPVDVWLDLDKFSEQEAQGDPAALAAATELYRGEFLEGLCLNGCPEFEIWLVGERERWRQRAAWVLEELVAHHSRRGAYRCGLRFARRLLALEPWREEAYRQVMRLLAWSGQRGAALAQYEACRRALMQELGVEPAQETTRLYQQIRDGALSVPAPSPARFQGPPHNLPAPLTPFIGREKELIGIRERLQDPACRLLTLVGPGGSGKTRLALEATAAGKEDFSDGVYFVSLVPLRSAEAIAPTATGALGLSREGEREPRRQLLDYVRHKCLLLIMDGFEGLLDGVGLVVEILRMAPGARILVTSQTRLNLKGETVFPIAGLDFPEGEMPEDGRAQDIAQYDAVKLFLIGARRVQPDFGLRDDNMNGVVRICRLVQGMPLEILMAAAWVGMLTPTEIAIRISGETGSGIDFLETDWRDVPERQRSLRGVFDHSWNLLTAREQEVFQGLSVLCGSFTRDAAQEVTGASLCELKALLDKSMLQRTPRGRYEVHELLRQYAAGKLGASLGRPFDPGRCPGTPLDGLRALPFGELRTTG